MLLVEALFALIRSSLGKVIEALFGWASAALFGNLPRSKRGVVTLAVAIAAAWPLLLLGIAFPNLAAFLVALVPFSDRIEEEALRAAWIGLALLAPLLVGLALSKGLDSRSRRNVLSGYPVTLGLAGAFVLASVVVPIRKIAAILSRRRSEHVPLVVPASAYHEVAKALRTALVSGGIPVEESPTPWSTRALTQIARRLGGASLARFFPENLPYLRGPRLELTLYPHGATLFGSARDTALAHALIAEAAVRTRALQTMTPEAQTIERRIKRLSLALQRSSRPQARAARLSQKLLRDIAAAPIDYAQWEILYRQSLQLLAAGPSPSEQPVRKALRDRAAH